MRKEKTTAYTLPVSCPLQTVVEEKRSDVIKLRNFLIGRSKYYNNDIVARTTAIVLSVFALQI